LKPKLDSFYFTNSKFGYFDSYRVIKYIKLQPLKFAFDHPVTVKITEFSIGKVKTV